MNLTVVVKNVTLLLAVKIIIMRNMQIEESEFYKLDNFYVLFKMTLTEQYIDNYR